MTVELLPDLVLCVLLLVVAWSALFASTRRDAMALFVAFGMIVALVWARLGAPDLALAEAAIGAGLTGVLLLRAARRLPVSTARRFDYRRHLGALTFIVVAVSGFAVSIILPSPADITANNIDSPVAAAMPDSGVSHPVTAVLLNFRAWDTFLELLVLLFAITGLRQLFPIEKESLEPARTWQLLVSWTRTLVPLLLLVGGYLLWRGSSGPGGAFQAGALLAAGCVMLRITGMLPPLHWSSFAVRGSVCAGTLLFLCTAVLTHSLGAGWLDYPEAHAGTLILMIETLATLSIAIILTLLVAGERKDLCS
ncbi:MAG: hydrogenase subunit MbhD domain-containing protein [Pseudomonadota bacterium]|nr:hydrogenase subunit MbhD domain-containing protein [Pseudomonadota bacterium]